MIYTAARQKDISFSNKKKLVFLLLYLFSLLFVVAFCYSEWYTKPYEEEGLNAAGNNVSSAEKEIVSADNLLHSQLDKILILKGNYLNESDSLNPNTNIIGQEKTFIKSLDSIADTRLHYTDNYRDRLDVITASFRFIIQNISGIDTSQKVQDTAKKVVYIDLQSTLNLEDSLKSCTNKIVQLEKQIKTQSSKNNISTVLFNDSASKQKIEFLSWALSSQVHTTNRLTNENNILKQNIANLTVQLNHK